MSIKPILFNTDMVRAILDGRKTVKRRLMKPQPKSKLCYTFAGSHKKDIGRWGYPSKTAHESWGEEYRLPDNIAKEDLGKRWNPPYHTDDILYVRETWYRGLNRILYKANYSENEKFYTNGKEIQIKWHPSIHMPKEAARIWLKVKDVRVERLQDITDEQLRKEGFIPEVQGHFKFKWTWNSTIKKSDLDRYGWDANPWVWVIELERCEKPGD